MGGEEVRAHGPRRLQVFDRWCHLGSTQDEAGTLALAMAPRAFDADVWRILARWLAVPAHLAQVRVLAAQGGEFATPGELGASREVGTPGEVPPGAV